MRGRVPKRAIVVDVEEVFLHCAKAFRRSGLWDSARRVDRAEMPSLSFMILQQAMGTPPSTESMRRIDDDLEREYRRTMY